MYVYIFITFFVKRINTVNKLYFNEKLLFFVTGHYSNEKGYLSGDQNYQMVYKIVLLYTSFTHTHICLRVYFYLPIYIYKLI